MITSLTILNFLSHKKTELEFSKGVNVIVGPTDSGKSAIIKALRWVVFNRPLGDGMRSSWGGGTAVEVMIDNQGTLIGILRGKDGSSNGYLFDKRQQFNAIKGEVPAEIQQALNLSDINLQTQFDSHFLLSSSSGEVAQYFNKVAHLDRIDSALYNIQKWGKEVQRKLEYDEQTLESTKQELASYHYLEQLEEEIARLEEKDAARRKLTLARSSIADLLTMITEVEEELAGMQDLQQLEDIVVCVLSVITKQKELRKDFVLLEGAVRSYKNVVQELVKVTEELTRLEDQFHKELGAGKSCPLCGTVIK